LPQRKISWFVYVVLLGNRFSRTHRDRIISEMKSRGIAAGRYFAPIHLQPIYLKTEKAFLPVTEACASRALALPFFNRIQDGEIAEVCRILHELLCFDE